MKHTYSRKKLEVVSELKYLRLCQLSYAASDARSLPPRNWELVQRTGRQTTGTTVCSSPTPARVDAVEICAILEKSHEKFLVLVAQYRPPLDAVCLEFPAGLIDGCESPGQAAIRELREETGFIVDESNIVSVSSPLSTECSLTDSCCVVVRFNVDGDRPENQRPRQSLDDGEDIEVLLIPFSEPLQARGEVLAIIHRYGEGGQRALMDAKLHTFLEAMSWK